MPRFPWLTSDDHHICHCWCQRLTSRVQPTARFHLCDKSVFITGVKGTLIVELYTNDRDYYGRREIRVKTTAPTKALGTKCVRRKVESGRNSTFRTYTHWTKNQNFRDSSVNDINNFRCILNNSKFVKCGIQRHANFQLTYFKKTLKVRHQQRYLCFVNDGGTVFFYPILLVQIFFSTVKFADTADLSDVVQCSIYFSLFLFLHLIFFIELGASWAKYTYLQSL